MEANTLIVFWRCIFTAVKERQEQGLPVKYADVIGEDFGLRNGRYNSIPDLTGVEIDDDLVYEFLRQSMVPKDERFEADLKNITMPGEEWRTIPGYSRYKASTLGRIWTSWSGKLLKPQLCGYRYPTVLVYTDDGRKRKATVHRLVAQTFIPNPEGHSTVDHINEDRMDARVCNLRWMSEKDNREMYMKNHGYWYNPDAWHPGKEPKRYECPADSDDEKWMNVIDFPEYFVSDLGRVWSIYSGEKTINRGNVSLLSGGMMRNKTVRMLVASAFLPPKKEGQVLRYRNGNRNDFRACNLYWAEGRKKPMSHRRGRPPRHTGALLIASRTSL